VVSAHKVKINPGTGKTPCQAYLQVVEKSIGRRAEPQAIPWTHHAAPVLAFRRKIKRTAARLA
jgi:hypothetical protein